MPDGSYPFPMYSGLLEPEHYKKIGSAIWLFLWCVSSTTSEKERDGIVWGIVHGNKPWKLSELAEPFGATEKTVSRWLNTLESNGYIKVTRAPYGLIISVHNSKKWAVERTDKNVRSEEESGQKCPISPPSEQTKMSDLPDKNVRSNKDITEIYKDAASSASDEDDILKLASQVERHFCQKRGKGVSVSPLDFSEIKLMIADGMPVDLINRVVDESFDTYKPKHRRDEIRSITYCIPRCYDEWTKLQQEEPITVAVPHVPVAIGSPKPQRITKQQQELEDLRRRAREEKQRGQSASI
ncbi:hypothetical protein NST04_28710 [Paenibacillus sp. FSL H7-0756]|uniref:hypothetical protein n=1 Tax=Paenibacillus sp. FSL H7-0756 TaxID=2954738 RepID=UPI0030F7DE99